MRSEINVAKGFRKSICKYIIKCAQGEDYLVSRPNDNPTMPRDIRAYRTVKPGLMAKNDVVNTEAKDEIECVY
jgi:hypothetical protein